LNKDARSVLDQINAESGSYSQGFSRLVGYFRRAFAGKHPLRTKLFT